MRSLTNVVDKKWLDLTVKNYKLQCKIRVIQHELVQSFYMWYHSDYKNMLSDTTLVTTVLSQ